MNEAFIPELIDALEREGKPEWARELRRHWEGKVDRFVNRTPNLYGSEFAFDSTGFESTGAFAKYLRTRTIASVPAAAAKKFTDFQLSLNMADRGWLETTYYQMGSDYRGNLTYLLSYMSQMGGWAILDHALHAAADPTDYLRLGYASSLSSWALVNSGTPESGYGYWFPSANNDGATGGGFMPEPLGRAWIGKQMAARRVVLQRGGRRRLLRGDPHARHDPRARSGVRRHRLRRRRDARRAVVQGDPARRAARTLSRRPWRSAPASRRWIMMASRRNSRSSSRTTCRGSSSCWRIAPAARIRRSCRSPACRRGVHGDGRWQARRHDQGRRADDSDPAGWVGDSTTGRHHPPVGPIFGDMTCSDVG